MGSTSTVVSVIANGRK